MKKVIKANGDITFVNEKYLDTVLQEGDVVDENYVVDKTPPTITPEDIEADNVRMLRELRNQKIAETDWWAGSDLTMTQAQIDYRQALRDITNTYSSYLDVVWPTKPE